MLINAFDLMVSGTKIVFLGLPDFEMRVDIACDLKRVTKNRILCRGTLNRISYYSGDATHCCNAFT